MKGLLIIFGCLGVNLGSPLENGIYTGGPDNIRQQTSPNNVPRIGKKSNFRPVVDWPVSTWHKGVPQAYLQIPHLSNPAASSNLPAGHLPGLASDWLTSSPAGYLPRLASDWLTSSPAGHLPGLARDWLTSSPAVPSDQPAQKRLMLPPGFHLPAWRSEKRSISPKNLRTSWSLGKRDLPLRVLSHEPGEELGRLKRAGDPRDEANYVWHNIIRSPQGFRFHDYFGDSYYTSRYKKGRDLYQELNSVPLLGKRKGI